MKRKNRNYSFSGWIANLGVVPLFLFLALRFLPRFFFLLCLLILVALVRETIIKLPRLNAWQFLPATGKSVKKLLLLCSFVTFLQVPGPGFAQKLLSGPQVPQGLAIQTLVLSKGEQKEIDLGQIYRFSVGQKEVISYRYLINKKSMLVKGKSMGFTDLVVWTKNAGKKTFHIYVLSKKTQLQLLSSIETLSFLGLATHLEGTVLAVEGELKDVEQYRAFLKIKDTIPKESILRVSLAKDLRNSLIGEVYNTFWRENIVDVSCTDIQFRIHCNYSSGKAISPEILTQLQQKIALTTSMVTGRFQTRNFLLKFQIVQIEKLDGRELNWGLSELVTDLNELYHGGIKAALLKNNVLLKDTSLDATTLATPELVTGLDTESLIELGQEVPYQISNAQGQVPRVQWKFAGLKIKFKLKESGNQFLLDFKSELTHPSGEAIEGSKQASHIVLVPGVPLQVFQIGHRADAFMAQKFPFLSQMPVLGEIFKSKNNNNNYKKLTGVVILE